ncbi:Rep [uncultured virus]|uniref:ATP-dependent helicase Rep n=1 Tax=uncultured virus TaxID=340016 RepID=A0A2K9LUN4_9VIRU|nr:Rep [uncultured virus]
MTGKPSRAYCFTVNNPVFVAGHKDAIPFNGDVMYYLVYQLEEGKSGTRHYQGYVEFKKAMRITAVHKLPGFGRAHFVVRKGTPQQASDYCKKTDGRLEGPWEHGKLSEGNGKKRTLADAIDKMDCGVTMTELAHTHANVIVCHGKGLLLLEALRKNVKRTWNCKVTVMYGAAGTGKSYAAQKLFPSAYHMPPVSTNGQPWFDGYQHSDGNIIINDFYGKIPMNYMLNLLDQYPMQLAVKGGFTPLLAKNIIITSNKSPELWYQEHYLKHPEHKEAFDRRIHSILFFNKQNGKVGDFETERNNWPINILTAINSPVVVPDHDDLACTPQESIAFRVTDGDSGSSSSCTGSYSCKEDCDICKEGGFNIYSYVEFCEAHNLDPYNEPQAHPNVFGSYTQQEKAKDHARAKALAKDVLDLTKD